MVIPQDIKSAGLLVVCTYLHLILISVFLMKLIILKNHLNGYAHRMITHLSISDANFDTAVEILERGVLDKNILLTPFSTLLMTQNPFEIRILNQLRCYGPNFKKSFSWIFS